MSFDPSSPYPRDLVGYGSLPPHPQWPHQARLALQIVVNYEEGGESSILHGDEYSEVFLQEVPGIARLRGGRDMTVESMYEYGSRVGIWRLLRVFRERGIPITVYAVGMAIARNPEVGKALAAEGHEVASHGWKWIDYQYISPDVERDHIRRSIEAIEQATGSRPLGWYTGRNSPRTRELVVEEGGFLYDADAYNDDLPYWVTITGKPHLVIPYTLDNNDMKFSVAPGFNSGEDFYTYLRDAFDVLYREGESSPKMMSVGLHNRLAGRPGRVAALERFLDHVQSHSDVWICRRVDIARHWIEYHPFNGAVGSA